MFNRKKKVLVPPHSRRPAATYAGLETLESRMLMSSVVFPADANVVDLSAGPYQVSPDATAEYNTTQINQAFLDNPRFATFYLPDGVYEVNDTLSMRQTGGPVFSGTFSTFQGESTEGTVLKLVDNSGIDGPVLTTGTLGSADLFYNHINNLTVDIGINNPDADGVQFFSNNTGSIRNVNIISGDGQGDVGLDLLFTNNGPLFVENVSVDGFTTGIFAGDRLMSQTLENITLRNQAADGQGIFNNGQVLNLRALDYEGDATAIINGGDGEVGKGATLTLLDSKINGTGAAADKPAILSRSKRLFIRDVETTGWDLAVDNQTFDQPNNPNDVATGYIDEYIFDEIDSEFTSPDQSLNLYMPLLSEVPIDYGPASNWVNVADFGAAPGDTVDDAPAVQAAIDSMKPGGINYGKTTLYFPITTEVARYRLDSWVDVSGPVQQIFGLNTLLQGEAGFRVIDEAGVEDAETLVFSRLNAASSGTPIAIETDSAVRTVRLSSIGDMQINANAAGRVLVDDASVKITLTSSEARVYAWQLNSEPFQDEYKFLNQGGTLVVFGYKTEKAGVIARTTHGGSTELLGAFVLPAQNALETNMIEIEEGPNGEQSSFFGANIRQLNFNGSDLKYVKLVSETRDNETRVWNEVGAFNFGLPIAAYSGYASTPLQEVRLEAEDNDGQFGVIVSPNNIGGLDNNNWVRFENIDFGNGGVTDFTIRAARGSVDSGKFVDLRTDSPEGEVIASIEIPSTGGWGNYQNFSTALTGVTGNQTLFLTFRGGSGIANIDWVEFTAAGNQTPVARPDFEVTIEGQEVAFDVLANDRDADLFQDPAVISATDGANGTTQLTGSTIVYTPNAGFSGVDTFQYTISDGNGQTATGQAEVTVVAGGQTINVGAINNGVLAQDDATGTGYILYSEENLFDRFDIDPFENNADHLIAVKFINGQWVYDTNDEYYAFTPRSTDVLIAEVDFTNDTAVGLEGVSEVENGIVKGIASSDLTYRPNWIGPTFNAGEFFVEGTSFVSTGGSTSTPTSGIKLATGVLENVGSDWQTVTLPESYESMVVVGTPNYGTGQLPAVVRIRNADGNSFEIRVQNPSDEALSGYKVHYTVVEEGVYTLENDGVNLEAIKVNSSTTNHSGDWSLPGELSLQNTYTDAVVLGQVQTENDADWSAFWSAGSARTNPASADVIRVGKHVGEDPDKTRADETLGVIVLESGVGEIDGVSFVAGLGADTVFGFDQTSTGYSYNFDGLDNATTAILSQTAMDGTHGGWAGLYGTDPLSSSNLRTFIDEDQVKDSERAHTSEQVGYLVFGDVTPPPVSQDIKLATGVLENVGSDWQTVTLPESYESMVVVGTPNYGAGQLPAVVRIRNADGNSFEIRVQNPSDEALSGYKVHYTVVEEGVYTLENDGVNLEAIKVNSSTTNHATDWDGPESLTLENSYSAPVVLGQVQTANDADWSAFWSSGSTRPAPASASSIRVGKHVGQDADKTRADETLGVIVLESGVGEIDGVSFVAGLGADTVRGFDTTSSGYSYDFNGLSEANTAILSQTAMDGTDGGWAGLYGTDPLSSSNLRTFIDEDQTSDSERAHTTEQVGYLVFGNASPQ